MVSSKVSWLLMLRFAARPPSSSVWSFAFPSEAIMLNVNRFLTPSTPTSKILIKTLI